MTPAAVMRAMLARPRELAAFALVGGVSSVVHVVVVAVLVPLGMAPLIANVLGFLAAFGVSFVGHDRWSFPREGGARPAALHRFFAVASITFVANETLYWLILRFTALPYRVGLVVVLLACGVLTWVLSKWWAFAAAR